MAAPAPPVPPVGVFRQGGPGRPPMDRRPINDVEAPSRSEFGIRRLERPEPPRASMPSSGPPSTGVWQRGNVVERKQEQPAPPPVKSNVYVPVHLRKPQQAEGQNASQDNQQPPRMLLFSCTCLYFNYRKRSWCRQTSSSSETVKRWS